MRINKGRPVGPILLALLCMMTAPQAFAEGDSQMEMPPRPAPSEDMLEIQNREAEAMEDYRQALVLIQASKIQEGKLVLEGILKDYPLSSAADRAFVLLERIASLTVKDPQALLALAASLEDDAAQTGMMGDSSTKQGQIQPSGVGEFIATQTLIAMTLGFQAPSLGSDSPAGEARAVGTLIGAGIGLGGSAIYTRVHDVTLPEVQSIYWAQITAGYNVRMLAGAFADNWGARERAIGDVIGVVAATPLGWALNRGAPRTSGQLSMAYSSAVWGGFSGFCIGSFLTERSDDGGLNTRYFLTLPSLVLADGALAASYVLGKKVNLSRSRMRLINLGGALGALAVGAGWVIASPTDSPNEFFTLGLVGGAGIGLGVATRLTQDWDAAHHPEVLTQAGTSNALLAYHGGQLRIGQPLPTPFAAEVIDDDGQRGQAPGVSLQLLEGTW